MSLFVDIWVGSSSCKGQRGQERIFEEWSMFKWRMVRIMVLEERVWSVVIDVCRCRREVR